MSDDAKPFVVVGELHGGHLEITAGSAQAAAETAQYWRTEYGATATWGLRHHTPARPVFMLACWLPGPGPGHADRTVHAFPLAPGQLVATEPAAYCGLRIPQERMDLCELRHGMPCSVCRVIASQTYTWCPRCPRTS